MPNELHLVTFRGNLQGQYRENVMHWHIVGATNDTAFQNSNALAQFIHTNIRPLWLAALPNDYFLDAIFVRRLGPTPGQYAAVDYEQTTEAGGISDNAVSQQLCPCITLIPPMGVKSAGKIFMPAVAKGSYQLNVATAGYVTTITTLVNAMIVGGSVAGGTATIVIYSKKTNATNVVSAFHLSPLIGYQRRRSTPIGT